MRTPSKAIFATAKKLAAEYGKIALVGWEKMSSMRGKASITLVSKIPGPRKLKWEWRDVYAVHPDGSVKDLFE